MPSILVAYVDPGSGTLLVQGLIAALCGGALFAARRCVAWLNSLRRKKPAAIDPAE
jgi:hypothetical protein